MLACYPVRRYLKIQYLCHELVGIKLCGCYVTGMNPVISDFISRYLIHNKRGIPTHILHQRHCFLWACFFPIFIIIIIELLCDSFYCHYNYLFEILNPSIFLRGIPCFMEILANMFHVVMIKFTWNATYKCLVWSELPLKIISSAICIYILKILLSVTLNLDVLMVSNILRAYSLPGSFWEERTWL